MNKVSLKVVGPRNDGDRHCYMAAPRIPAFDNEYLSATRPRRLGGDAEVLIDDFSMVSSCGVGWVFTTRNVKCHRTLFGRGEK